jgi:hypothetical protein
MKKLRSRQARLPLLPAIAIGIAALVVTASVLFSSCDLFTYKRPFADAYYDNNFIANIGFDKFVGASTTVPTTEVTGSWDFAYRYEDGWADIPANSVQYMSLVDTGATASTYGSADGLSPTAKVYRLEMENLITDGDFETSAGTWTTVGTTSLATWTTSPTLPINNYVMELTLDGESNYLTYTPTPISGQVITGKKYQIDFKWKSSGEPGATNKIVMNSKTTSVTFSTVTGHAQDDFTSEASNVVTFKTSGFWQGSIDDVSLRKVGGQRLRLLLKKTETTPNLEDFLYKFTFWVHPDTSVGPYTSPYNLDKFDTKMLPVDKASSFNANRDGGIYRYSASATGWQKMTVYIDNGNLQIVPGATGAVMELSIDLDEALPGRILIAQPELRAYPDGY